jgi:hypothetical protein
MRVLDLGGMVQTWVESETRPQHVTLLNFKGTVETSSEQIRSHGAEQWMTAVEGDACDPPPEIREQRFDLVFSNSVIEHVGGHLRRRHFSYWVQTLGKHHWVQTPNRYFPMEPHWLVPGLQFAPPRLQVFVLRHWPLEEVRYYRTAPWHDGVQRAMGIELLSPGAMRSYFPESELLRERILGMTKSLIVTA